MHHTWFLPPRRVLEGSLPPPPSPVQQERRCNNYVHLVCICPKPCSKKGESTGNWRPERRGLGNTGGTTTDRRWLTAFYEGLLRGTVPALGFCWSSPDQVVITAAEEGIRLRTACIECSLLRQERNSSWEKKFAWGEREGVGGIWSLGLWDTARNGFTMRSCWVALRTRSRYLYCNRTKGGKKNVYM